MLIERCPQCRAPLVDGEVHTGICPVCEAPLVEPTPEPVPPAGTPPVVPGGSSFGRGLAVGLLAGGLLASLLAMMFWPTPSEAEPGELVALRDEHQATLGQLAETWKKLADAEAATGTAQEAVKVALAEQTGRAEDLAKKETLALQQRDQARTQLAEAEERAGSLAKALAEAKRAVAAGDVRPDPMPERVGPVVNIDQPDGEYLVPALDNGRSLKLTGRVKTLKVTSVNGGATLDAGELKAESVVVVGTLNGGTRSLFQAGGGRVVIPEVNGGSAVWIKAPGSGVEIRGVNGDSRVVVLAKDVHISGAVNGERTRIDATLNTGGSLRFQELAGGSSLIWRSELADAPDPKIEPGVIHRRAKFSKGE